MFCFLFHNCNSIITSNISSDLSIVSLKGEYEDLSQATFNKFANADKIKFLTLEGFTILRIKTFSGCLNMQKIDFKGNSLTTIESGCFESCSNLISIEFPYGLRSIGDLCFQRCSNLESITFPETLTTFDHESGLFYDCQGLKRFVVNQNNKNLSASEDGSILIFNKTVALFCVNKDTIIIPSYITEIGKFFINNLNLIKHVEYETGSNLIHIHRSAFRWGKITKMIFPPKLKIIEIGIFEFCKIETLFLPKSLEEVANDLFVGQPLTNLTVEQGIKALKIDSEGNIFNKNYTVLMYIKPNSKSIEIKNQTKEVESKLFNIESLVNITVEPGNKDFYAWNNLLYYKDGLKAAPGGIVHAVLDGVCTKILHSAFYYRQKLQSIDFNGSKITGFDGSAFLGCSSLTQFEIPETLEWIGWYCITTIKVRTLKFGPKFRSLGSFSITSTNLIKIDFSDSTNLLTLSESCLANNHNLKKITLPPYLESISKSAIAGCPSIENITIPQTVETLGESSFSCCSLLKEVIFKGNELKTISAMAFENCNLSEVVFPDSLTEIQRGAFSGNKFLRAAIFSEDSQLETLSFNAFRECGMITEIFLGRMTEVSTGVLSEMLGLLNVTVSPLSQRYSSIGGVLHSKDGTKLISCPGGIESLKVSENVTAFEQSAFLGCSNLKSIEMDEDQNISAIPQQTFFGCSSLLRISVPRAVEKIEEKAFEGCESLAAVAFAAGSKLESLGPSAFSGCKALENVSFEEGSSLRTIEDDAFSGCFNLSVFTFGENVTLIGSRAFRGCPLNKILFRSRLESIGENCFEGSKAREVFLPQTVERLGSMCFSSCTKMRRIFYCGNSSFENVIIMSREEREKGKAIFYARSTYPYQNAGGFTPIRILDEKCQIPTFEFTKYEGSNSQTVAFVGSLVLNDSIELGTKAREEREKLHETDPCFEGVKQFC